MNALNAQLLEEMRLVLEQADSDEEARVVVITGAGRGFCSGADLSPGPEGERFIDKQHPEVVRLDVRRLQILTRLIRKMNKVVIAMVNGPAVGAGFDLASACDLRIGCENASFRVGFVRLGLVPGTGGTWFLPQLIGVSKSAELIFTNETMGAEEAQRIGYLNRLVPEPELEETTMALAEKVAGLPPITLRLAKLQLYEGLHFDLDTALDMIAVTQGVASSTDDHREAVDSFREKREADFRGT
jgi:2-(1,2-epoxy-1,2-dihydrophenyl)acetyl-CoA isomerase